MQRADRAPLYTQARRVILEELRQRRWEPGSRLPPEPELAAEIGVSVGTLRRAVAELVEEGILVRRQGSGTFVHSYSSAGYWNRLQPFQALDGKPLTLDVRRPVVFERIAAPAEIALRLHVGEGAPLLHIVRQMGCSGPDAVDGIDELYLREEVFPGFTMERFVRELGQRESLYGFYERVFGVEILGAGNLLRWEVVDGPTARRLRTPQMAGLPVFHYCRVARTYGNAPVEFRDIRIDARRVQVAYDL